MSNVERGINPANSIIKEQNDLPFIPRDKQGRIRWSSLKDNPEILQKVIEDETRMLFETHGYLSQRQLNAQKRQDLSHAISRHYPGQMEQLKINLGLEAKGKPSGYWTKERIEEEARVFVEENGNLTQILLVQNGRGKLSSAVSRNYPGGMYELKKTLGLTLSRTPNNYWTPDLIRSEAKRIYQEQGRLSGYALTKNKNSGFAAAVNKFYSGGFRQLRIDLGLDEIRKPDGYWAPETIEKETREIFKNEGNFSYTILRRIKRFDLGTAITHSYPGGIRELRKKLGLQEKRKPKGAWNPEIIEKESQEFINRNGNLTIDLLYKNKMSGLAAAITTYYPGGIYTLQLKLGLNPQSVPNGYWTPDKIEQDAIEFYKKEGKLTSSLLKEKGYPNLATVISSDYPGGMNALKAKLGINFTIAPEGYWTKERIEKAVVEFCKISTYISEHNLVKHGRSDLAYVITHYYPGRFQVLRSNLGIHFEKERIIWTPQRIEEEARSFYEKFGGLTHKLLIGHKLSGLSSAIVGHYPGSYAALKEKLGISVPKPEDTISPEQANERLMKFLEVKDE